MLDSARQPLQKTPPGRRYAQSRGEADQSGASRAPSAPPTEPRLLPAPSPCACATEQVMPAPLAQPTLRRAVSFFALSTDLKEPSKNTDKSQDQRADISFRHISGCLNLSFS